MYLQATSYALQTRVLTWARIITTPRKGEQNGKGQMSRGQRGSGKGRRRAFVHRRRGGKGGVTGPPTAATMLVNVEEANVDRRYIYVHIYPKGRRVRGVAGRWVIDGSRAAPAVLMWLWTPVGRSARLRLGAEVVANRNVIIGAGQGPVHWAPKWRPGGNSHQLCAAIEPINDAAFAFMRAIFSARGKSHEKWIAH